MCGSMVEIQYQPLWIGKGKKKEEETRCGPMPNVNGRPAEYRDKEGMMDDEIA